jgi:pyridoxal 5'-phosphate synthase pdxS subunit
VVSAVKHARIIQEEIAYIQRANEEQVSQVENKILEGFQRINKISELGIEIENTPFGSLNDCRNNISSVIKDIQKLGRLPVVTFSAGGIATPADAALMMNMGMDGIFVGSGIFKSENPTQTAEAIVYATHHFDDPSKVTEASTMVGEAMPGLEIEGLDVKMENRGW